MSALRFDRRFELVTVVIERPILSCEVLNELELGLTALARDPSPYPIVVASAHPTIFLAGADLAEIAGLDAASCLPYARLGRGLIRSIEEHPAPVIAAVGGSCTGGGFDLALGCDAVVASSTATFAHPGVFRGLVTGWGGTTSLPNTIGPSSSRAALLEGGVIDAQAALELGLVWRLADNPVTEAAAEARRMTRLDPSRLPLWRLLKHPSFVDRFRAAVIEKS